MNVPEGIKSISLYRKWVVLQALMAIFRRRLTGNAFLASSSNGTIVKRDGMEKGMIFLTD